MRWFHHVQYILKRTRYLLFVFKKLRNFFSLEVLLRMYHAFFCSIAFYGIIAWGGAYQYTLHPLKILQKRILKIIFRAEHLNHIKEKLAALSLLDVENKYKVECIVREYNEMSLRSRIRGNRRQQISIPLCKRNIGQKSYRYCAIKNYNALPSHLKTLTLDKSQVKRQIVDWMCTN